MNTPNKAPKHSLRKTEDRENETQCRVEKTLHLVFFVCERCGNDAFPGLQGKVWKPRTQKILQGVDFRPIKGMRRMLGHFVLFRIN